MNPNFVVDSSPAAVVYSAAECRVDFEGIPNARDLGGRVARDGRRVELNKIFRSMELVYATDSDKKKIIDLGITQIFDLRTAAEIAKGAEPKIDGVAETQLDVLADATSSMASQLKSLMSDQSRMDAFTEADGLGLMKSTYVDIVTSGSALSAYQRFFRDLLTNDGGALFHCTTGKDRTGWAAASFYSLMGVDHEAIFDDYLQTNTDLLPALKPILDTLAAKGASDVFLDSVVSVKAEYLETAFATVDEKFGSMAGYFTNGLQLDATTQDQLRNKFLVAAG